MSDINNDINAANDIVDVDTDVNESVESLSLTIPPCNMCFKYKKLNQYLNECDDNGTINIHTLYTIIGETITNEDCKDFLHMLSEILQNYNCDV